MDYLCFFLLLKKSVFTYIWKILFLLFGKSFFFIWKNVSFFVFGKSLRKQNRGNVLKYFLGEKSVRFLFPCFPLVFCHQGPFFPCCWIFLLVVVFFRKSYLKSRKASWRRAKRQRNPKFSFIWKNSEESQSTYGNM